MKFEALINKSFFRCSLFCLILFLGMMAGCQKNEETSPVTTEPKTESPTPDEKKAESAPIESPQTNKKNAPESHETNEAQKEASTSSEEISKQIIPSPEKKDSEKDEVIPSISEKNPQESEVWKNYVKDREARKQTQVPDFSYAGYHQGEEAIPNIEGPLFDVTKYGAIPNDEGDDQDAIQKTIDAAEAAGGGVVYLPAGVYWTYTDIRKRHSIRVTHSHIVIRGAGMEKGGTTIYMHQPVFGPADRAETPKSNGVQLIEFASPTSRLPLPETPPLPSEKKTEKPLARITEFAGAGSKILKVSETRRFKEGQWISIYLRDLAHDELLLNPFKLMRFMKKRSESGITCEEKQQIKAVREGEIELSAVTQYEIDPQWNWAIYEWSPLTEVGIEDLTIIGRWMGRFVHHRGDYDDRGWSALTFKSVANGWVRRVGYISTTLGTKIYDSAQISVVETRYAGNSSHCSSSIENRSNRIFSGLNLDEAHHWHGQSVSNSVGTVFWRTTEHPEDRIDIHVGNSMNTLYDRIDGGTLLECGGDKEDGPNHLRGLVFWNYLHQRNQMGKPGPEIDFWSEVFPLRAIYPFVIGMYGSVPNFKEEHMGTMESLGAPVLPESLFEAQLELRLGHKPAWIEELRKEWEMVSQKRMPPDCGYKNDPDLQFTPLHFSESKIVEIVKSAASIQINARTEPKTGGRDNFEIKIETDPGSLKVDEVLLRQAIFFQMSYLYGFSTRGNQITVRKITTGEQPMIQMEARAPRSEKNSPPTVFFDHPAGSYREDWRYLSILTKKIGASLEKVEESEATKILLNIPEEPSP
ncbi:MAG: DUF4955 domain-containing protein [Verrucomicrobiota bacterium]